MLVLDVVMHEISARTYPDLGGHFEIEVGKPVGWHQTTVSDAARRLLRRPTAGG